MLMFSTSQRMVYSILTRSREYSNAIHCTPLLSCRTTSGVVAGMGPGAALVFELELPAWPLDVDELLGAGCVEFKGVLCGADV